MELSDCEHISVIKALSIVREAQDHKITSKFKREVVD